MLGIGEGKCNPQIQPWPEAPLLTLQAETLSLSTRLLLLFLLDSIAAAGRVSAAINCGLLFDLFSITVLFWALVFWSPLCRNTKQDRKLYFLPLLLPQLSSSSNLLANCTNPQLQSHYSSHPLTMIVTREVTQTCMPLHDSKGALTGNTSRPVGEAGSESAHWINSPFYGLGEKYLMRILKRIHYQQA